MIDLIYQATATASVITFAVIGLALRRAIDSAERRRHYSRQGRRR